LYVIVVVCPPNNIQAGGRCRFVGRTFQEQLKKSYAADIITIEFITGHKKIHT
jgi:hypothetical protein